MANHYPHHQTFRFWCRGNRKMGRSQLQKKQKDEMGPFRSILVGVIAVAQAEVLRGDRTGRVLQTTVAVTDLRLVLANSTREIGSIRDNQLFYLNDQPGSSFNIKAVVSGMAQSVRFGYNSTTNYRTESGAPYCLCGDTGGIFAACAVLGVGLHTVTATPFAVTGGSAGTARTVRFQIVAGSAPAPPTVPVTPVAAPVMAPATVPVTPVAAPVMAPASPPVPGRCRVPKVRHDDEAGGRELVLLATVFFR
jgi:hypothetical protein